MSRTKKKKTLLETFETLEKSTKLKLACVSTPLDLCLIALNIAKEQTEFDQLTAEHIEACLEIAGVAIKKQSIINALSRSGGKVKSFSFGPDTYYKIMTKGEIEAEQALERGGLSVVCISSGTPRTSRRGLEDVLSTLTGDTIICDPYYGIRTLDSLEKIGKKTHVRFLTQKTSESGRKLTTALKDFKREFRNIEIRVADNTTMLHDRYIIDGKKLYIIGHGLKDIGNRDSFVIVLEKDLASDLIHQIRKTFNAYWPKATDL